MTDPKAGPAKAPARVTDALSKWEAEAGQAPAGLAEIRLDANERLLVPFTTSVVEVQAHYVDYRSLTGYIACNGGDRLLCRIGRQPETRDLLPVYDPVAQSVGVLPVSPNMRPHALKPQLLPVLRRIQQNERVLLAIRKEDRVRYTVNTLDLPDDADDGAAEIGKFLDALEARTIDPRAIYVHMENDVLATIPEVANQMRLRGVSL
jgi:hypothetical protein